MVLLGLGTTWGCTQWLHREDYTVFDLSDNPDGKDERGSGKMEEASVARASADEPSQYWLIGFKDRRLEREYLEDLVDVSFFRLLVGTSLALFLSLNFLVRFYISALILLFAVGAPPSQIVPYIVACVLTAIAFIGALVVLGFLRRHSFSGSLGTKGFFCSLGGRKYPFLEGRKYIALYAIEAAYLLYIFGCIWSFVAGFYYGDLAGTAGMMFPMAYW